MEEGTPANVSREEVPAISSSPTEEAHSDDSNSGLLDLDDQPGSSGTSGQPVTQAQSHTTTEPPHQETPPQHPFRVPTPLSPGHGNQQCVNQYKKPTPPLIPKTIRDLESVAVGTRFRGQRHRPTGELGGVLCAREPTLQEALAEILGAYQHSQDTMGQILDNVQENKQLQEGQYQYQGIREDFQAINNTLVSIAGVLVDMANIMREAVLHQQAPATSQISEQPSTSTAASGQEAPP
ncbi:hypothetical protein NDU88_002734 [Pleurodeles waltl]|uniref:Uncharacterized protein n=1 Tax=Pleurodeles waltl TaxID=8319 RepID=A0AAV7KVJ6_PLEWA|nr:hypothetical protein NDU88_002734 [Pleurodeles waltl]